MVENDTGNLWKEVRRTAGKLTELETTMKLEIPALKTGISDLKEDMKDGFKSIGDKLDGTRTREDETREREDNAKALGHKRNYAAMYFVIGILVSLAIRLAMAGGS